MAMFCLAALVSASGWLPIKSFLISSGSYTVSLYGSLMPQAFFKMVPDSNKIKPVVVQANHTSITPSESFEDTSRGLVTWHTLFSTPTTPTSDMCAGVGFCQPRTGHLCAHRHLQAEIYYILEGKGKVKIDGIVYPVQKDCSVFIPGHAEHEIWNIGDGVLRWFYVFPTESFQDVIYRFSPISEEQVSAP